MLHFITVSRESAALHAGTERKWRRRHGGEFHLTKLKSFVSNPSVLSPLLQSGVQSQSLLRLWREVIIRLRRPAARMS